MLYVRLEQERRYYSPLALAISFDKPEMMDLLLDYGAVITDDAEREICKRHLAKYQSSCQLDWRCEMHLQHQVRLLKRCPNF